MTYNAQILPSEHFSANESDCTKVEAIQPPWSMEDNPLNRHFFVSMNQILKGLCESAQLVENNLQKLNHNGIKAWGPYLLMQLH